MSLAVLADHLARQGRNGDTMLVHMTPKEVAGLHALALSHGGSLTINPETGLVEAGWLSKLLPAIAGFALNAFLPGVGTAIGSALGLGGAAGTAIAVGGITGLATGSLQKGLMAGLGAYGGAGLAGGMANLGESALVNAAGDTAAREALGQKLTGDAYDAAIERATQQAMSSAAPTSILSEGAKAAVASPSSFLKAVGGGSTMGGLSTLATAASPVIADAMVPTATKMPTIGTATPYIRPMIIDRKQVAAQPLTGSSERKWFETKYEVPPPINALTGRQLPAPAAQTGAQTATPQPGNVYPPSPYDQPYYGGLNGGGLVALAEGGLPVDVPEILKTKQQLAIDPQKSVTLAGLPDYATTSTSKPPGIAQSSVEYGKAPTGYEGNPNLTATAAGLPALTGESKAAYDYLMGGSRVPAPQTPPRSQSLGFVMPRTVTPAAGGTGSGTGTGVGASVGAGAGVGTGVSLPGNVDLVSTGTIGNGVNRSDSSERYDDTLYNQGSNTGTNFGNRDVDYTVTDSGNLVDTAGTPTDFSGSLTGGVIPAIIGRQPPAPVEDRVGRPVDDILNTSGTTTSSNTGNTFDNYNDTTYGSTDNTGNVATTGNTFDNYNDAAYGSTSDTGNTFDNYNDTTYGANVGGGGFSQYDFDTDLMASGGIAGLTPQFNLGGYSDGGRLLKGPGDGVSDSIPATIGHSRQPARLADGEFVIPARIVSELGNGSTDAGARELYKMMDRIQKARSKTVGKGRVANNTRATKYLPA